MLLVVDAAHGGTDTGTKANGKMEKQLVLKFCSMLQKLAPEYNVEVLLTRADDKYMEPAERQDIANAAAADAFISIHINKSNTAEFRPYEIFVVPGGQREKESIALARAVMKQLKGVGKDTLLTERAVLALNGCKHPAIALECGDIGAVADVSFMEDENGLCRNLLSAVVTYGNNR